MAYSASAPLLLQLLPPLERAPVLHALPPHHFRDLGVLHMGDVFGPGRGGIARDNVDARLFGLRVWRGAGGPRVLACMRSWVMTQWRFLRWRAVAALSVLRVPMAHCVIG